MPQISPLTIQGAFRPAISRPAAGAEFEGFLRNGGVAAAQAPAARSASSSETGRTSATQAAVRSAVQLASSRTSVDFDYLLGQARLESGLNPNARAKSSSASGLFQFLSGTWLDTLQKHGAKHGLEWASQQIEQTGRGPIIRDPAVRDQVLALRYDPQISSLMAGEYASDNRQALQTSTGREPTATDLYLAHFLGPAGAGDFLRNMQTNPGASAATFFPQAAAANRAIFYAEGGGARSLGEVYGLLGAKVAGAIDRNGGATFQDFDPSLALAPGAAAQVSAAPPEWTAARQEWAEASNRPSMSEVLRSSFGVGSNGADAASANVNKAYGALKAFDL